jgi:hypothetical protein
VELWRVEVGVLMLVGCALRVRAGYALPPKTAYDEKPVKINNIVDL